MIPFPVILTELILAAGLALLGANAVAWFRLHRDHKVAPSSSPGGARPGATAAVPSRGRILAGMAVGLLVTLVAVATFVTRGYSL